MRFFMEAMNVTYAYIIMIEEEEDEEESPTNME